MKFIILHGWQGNPIINWFTWLGNKLEQLGHEVIIPELPNSDFPKLSSWLSKLNSLLKDETDQVVLIGHSLGGVLMLHYLEQVRKLPLVKLAVFVASWGEDDGKLEPPLANFFPKPFNFDKIKRAAKKFISISSSNDPYIEKKFSQSLAESLGIKPIWVERGGHFNEEAGFEKFPLLLDTIKRTLSL